MIDRLPAGPLDLFDPAVAEFVTTLSIDVTTRCNLSCRSCFSRSVDPNDTSSDPPLEEILSWIPDFRQRRRAPNLTLIGGESTLRKDLPEIIEAIRRQKGLIPRLCSNGVLLSDERLLVRLRAAGLRWVLLQFDGFGPSPSITFRGVDLVTRKARALEALSTHGFLVNLNVMVEEGVNDGDTGPILRFAARHPAVRSVGFFPRCVVGRTGARPPASQVADVMTWIERTTDGEITLRDWRAARRIGAVLFRATGVPLFRQRDCLASLPVLRSSDRLIPATRLLRPSGMLSETGALLRLLRSAPALLDPDQGRLPRGLILVHIERLYDAEAFDDVAARDCHNVYLSGRGAWPFCIYNARVREARETPPA